MNEVIARELKQKIIQKKLTASKKYSEEKLIQKMALLRKNTVMGDKLDEDINIKEVS